MEAFNSLVDNRLISHREQSCRYLRLDYTRYYGAAYIAMILEVSYIVSDVIEIGVGIEYD